MLPSFTYNLVQYLRELGIPVDVFRNDKISVQDIGNTNFQGIYEATGAPDDNGWLATAEGQSWVANNGGAPAEALYRAFINHPYSWGTPRQIRLGMRFDFNP